MKKGGWKRRTLKPPAYKVSLGWFTTPKVFETDISMWIYSKPVDKSRPLLLCVRRSLGYKGYAGVARLLPYRPCYCIGYPERDRPEDWRKRLSRRLVRSRGFSDTIRCRLHACSKQGSSAPVVGGDARSDAMIGPRKNIGLIYKWVAISCRSCRHGSYTASKRRQM